jgi:hypothetical protein
MRVIFRTLVILLMLTVSAPGYARRLPAPEPATTAKPPVTQPPAGQYLFVEFWVAITGTGQLPMLCIDFPGYHFDEAQDRLIPFADAELPQLAASDWGLAGNGTSRAGAAGCGAAGGLEPVNSLPYTTTLNVATGEPDNYGVDLRAAPVALQAISAGGTLTTTIDGTEVLLAAGEDWSHTVTVDLETAEFTGQYQVTSSVTNYGWQSRTNIQRAEQFVWLPLLVR